MEKILFACSSIPLEKNTEKSNLYKTIDDLIKLNRESIQEKTKSLETKNVLKKLQGKIFIVVPDSNRKLSRSYLNIENIDVVLNSNIIDIQQIDNDRNRKGNINLNGEKSKVHFLNPAFLNKLPLSQKKNIIAVCLSGSEWEYESQKTLLKELDSQITWCYFKPYELQKIPDFMDSKIHVIDKRLVSDISLFFWNLIQEKILLIN